MSLRRSPRRTRALLAANRRNSRKSTGPRTFEGKWHSSGNAVRHYRRTQFASCIPIENRESKAFEDFLSKLRDAIIPADNAAGTEAVLLKAAEVWRVKLSFERWIETRTEEDWLVLAAGAVPPPRSWRLKLRRPGLSAPDWVVTASVCLRWGRDLGRSRRSAAKDNERPDRPRMHTLVSVHTTGPRFCSGSGRPVGPEFAPGDADVVGPGLVPTEADPRACPERSEGVGPTGDLDSQRTKPESTTIQSGSENMSDPRFSDPAYAEAYAVAERIVGWFMGWGKRTKPESLRKQEVCKNMSPVGERGGQNPSGSGVAISLGTRLGKIFGAVKAALVPRKAYSQLPLFQTNPECFRKEAASPNMSKDVAKIGGVGWG